MKAGGEEGEEEEGKKLGGWRETESSLMEAGDEARKRSGGLK